MKALASILVIGASLTAFPALADSTGPVGGSVILTGGEACVGPFCVGRDRDRDWRYRHHGYAYERGYGCRDVTIRRDDGSVRHIRRCD
jgi:hypothetical protein